MRRSASLLSMWQLFRVDQDVIVIALPQDAGTGGSWPGELS